MISYASTNEQKADILTKGLAKSLHHNDQGDRPEKYSSQLTSHTMVRSKPSLGETFFSYDPCGFQAAVFGGMVGGEPGRPEWTLGERVGESNEWNLGENSSKNNLFLLGRSDPSHPLDHGIERFKCHLDHSDSLAEHASRADADIADINDKEAVVMTIIISAQVPGGVDQNAGCESCSDSKSSESWFMTRSMANLEAKFWSMSHPQGPMWHR